MILRPYGIVIDGKLELGLELIVQDGTIQQIRPHTGLPESFIVSPAFVNAHSHMEYRGMQGKLKSTEYWPWIREITELKRSEVEMKVRRDAIAAAQENHATGVAAIAEHSDRPVAATAMVSAGLQGVIFQETITFFESQSRAEKLRAIRQKAAEQAKIVHRPVPLTPHAYHTVDRQTLAEFGQSKEPISIHVAETELESQFTRTGDGAIGDFYRQFDIPFEPIGKGIVPTLADLGLARPGAQFVHCCALEEGDIDILAKNQVAVAHCPRSNVRLKCPTAPVRRMLDAGIPVGLGLDSPASSGPIDMFAEMRAALKISLEIGEAVLPETAWQMATSMGARSLGFAGLDLGSWDVKEGSKTPLIRIHLNGANTVEDLIEGGSPSKVDWVLG